MLVSGSCSHQIDIVVEAPGFCKLHPLRCFCTIKAAREQLGTDAFALQLQAAPEVNDVLYVAGRVVCLGFGLQRLGRGGVVGALRKRY